MAITKMSPNEFGKALPDGDALTIFTVEATFRGDMGLLCDGELFAAILLEWMLRKIPPDHRVQLDGGKLAKILGSGGQNWADALDYLQAEGFIDSWDQEVGDYSDSYEVDREAIAQTEALTQLPQEDFDEACSFIAHGYTLEQGSTDGLIN